MKFPIPPFCRTIPSPNGLDLISLERKGQIILVHDYKACKWYSQVITKGFLRNLKTQFLRIIQISRLFQEISIIENFENQLISFFSIFSRKDRKLLHRRSFNWHIAMLSEYRTNGIKNEFPPDHCLGPKISGAFRYGRSLCHVF